MADLTEAEAWLSLLMVVRVPLSKPFVAAADVYQTLDERYHLSAAVPPSAWPKLWRVFMQRMRAHQYTWAEHAALGNVAYAVYTAERRASSPIGTALPSLHWREPISRDVFDRILAMFERRSDAVMIVSPGTAPDRVATLVQQRDPVHVFAPVDRSSGPGPGPGSLGQSWALLWVARKQSKGGVAATFLDPTTSLVDSDEHRRTIKTQFVPRALWKALLPSGSNKVAPLAFPGPVPHICDPAESAVCVLYYLDQATASITKTPALTTPIPARILSAYRWHLVKALEKH